MANDPFERLLGRSAAAETIRTFGRRAAAVDASVLLLGESGTGKGILARAIHDASRRGRGPFVAVNCAAIPETLFESEFFGHVRGAFTGAQYAHKGLFEQAQGGTLFLDEVGELPLMAQAKLLTAIEDRVVRRVGGERVFPFDIRIIAATAADLLRAVETRAFRRDLFHRVQVLHFTIPPLRARHGDIAVLADEFVTRYAARYEKGFVALSGRAYSMLEMCAWHGNIRELAHTIESAVLCCENGVIQNVMVAEASSYGESGGGAGLFDRKTRYSYGGSAVEERRMIDTALARCSGNKTRAAAELGMSRNTLLNKLRRLDVSA